MTSVEQLNIVITKLGEDWKEKLDKFLKEEDVNIEDEGRGEIVKFLNICKEEVIENETSTQKEVEQLVNNDLVYKNIQEYVNGQLRPYYATSVLRTIAVKDAERIKTVIKEIFDMVILRYNPQILQEYEKFGYVSEDAFIEFLNILDSMCSLIVKRNLHIDAIEKFIYMNTRLPKDTCKQMAKIIDKNFESLKMSYIIEELSKLD